MTELLIVTAVAAEADAVRAGADLARVTVEPVGVGSAAAAAATARLLMRAEADGAPYRAVISAGIAGGFPGHAERGATVVGTRSIAADLGAETPDGFLPVEALGFGTSVLEADPGLLRALASALPGCVVGDILTPKLLIRDGAAFRGRIDMPDFDAPRVRVPEPAATVDTAPTLVAAVLPTPPLEQPWETPLPEPPAPGPATINSVHDTPLIVGEGSDDPFGPFPPPLKPPQLAERDHERGLALMKRNERT